MTNGTQDALEIAAVDAPLTNDEQQDLKELEGVIERGQKTFVEVGQALASIRNDRLYRSTHGSWEAYLAERWPSIQQRMADRLIGAAEVQGNLGPIGLSLSNESQARPLVGLKPDQQRAAMQEASQVTGGKPTAKTIEQAAAKFKLPPDYVQVGDRAFAVGWKLTHDGSTYVLTPPTGSPVLSDQWSLIVSKVSELTRQAEPAPVAPAATPLPLSMPAAPAAAMPPPLMMTPLAPAAGVIDDQDLIRAAVCVAYCEALLRHAQARLVELQGKAGIPLPELELPGDAIGSAARIGLDAPPMRMQLMGLMMGVRKVA